MIPRELHHVLDLSLKKMEAGVKVLIGILGIRKNFKK